MDRGGELRKYLKNCTEVYNVLKDDVNVNLVSGRQVESTTWCVNAKCSSPAGIADGLSGARQEAKIEPLLNPDSREPNLHMETTER